MIRIIQYRDKCIGCYACVEAAPDRWRISRKDGKSVLIEGKPKKNVFLVQVSEAELSENKIAAANCPVKIIRIVE
jgi:ferredoxin